MPAGGSRLSGPVLAPPVADTGPDVGEARFGVGDRVRVREWHPPGHTRCPSYVRGKAGVVVRLDGTYSVPDIEAHGAVRRREPTYSVRFDAADLWQDAQRGVSVHVGLWDSYLEGLMTGEGHHPAAVSPVEHRVAALEALLTERGLVPEGFMEEVTRRYESEIGPMNGAKVVARAWADPEYKARLLADGTAAIAELGFGGAEGDHMVVVENTAAVHNVIVCTLCSCYPWPVLGLPPAWYKDPPYRARVVREPRALLAEMGCLLPADMEIRVWDSSAEVRYLVLPNARPGPRT